jgi:hypothetical protein
MAAPENTGEKQAGRFRPGESGNPAGRPRGARNKATLAVQALLDGEAVGIARRAVELALEGDTTAMRLVLERVLPPRKDTHLALALPPADTAEQVQRAMAAVLHAVCGGDITPQEGQALAALLEQQRKCLDTATLEKRLDALQAILKNRS